MNRYFLVLIGGSIGSVVRYWLSGAVHARFPMSFPAGTFVVNIVGCLVFGLIVGWDLRSEINPGARLFLLTGVCGGFTTFSAFSHDTLNLLQLNQIGAALANVGGQVVISLIVLWLGITIARAI